MYILSYSCRKLYMQAKSWYIFIYFDEHFSIYYRTTKITQLEYTYTKTYLHILIHAYTHKIKLSEVFL